MTAIEPIRVFPDTATSVEFSAITLVPYDKAWATWRLYDAAGKQLASGQVEMTHEQYIAWGTEDTYAEDCFLLNLGLIRAA